MTTTAAPFDQARFEAALHRLLNDVGSVITAASVITGDKLGLYKALASAGPLTSEELAQRTQTHERYVREWLANQAAAGYLTYDPQTRCFTLPAEHVPFFADDDSEVNMCGMFGMGQPLFVDEPKITEAFKTGKGIGWEEHDPRLYGLTDRIFRNGYAAHLVQDWIPALEGAEAKLRTGASVADVGCGHGSSTIQMAKAYPMSRFVGYDYHLPSIEAAREAAAKAALADRVRFEVATANALPEKNFDLICCFDCVHDMGDPVGALAHIRSRAQGQRHADDGRTVRGGHARIEYHTCRPRLLRCFDHALHAGIARAGRWPGAGRAGRREPHTRGGATSRIFAVPPRDGNAVQSRLRGETVRYARPRSSPTSPLRRAR